MDLPSSSHRHSMQRQFSDSWTGELSAVRYFNSIIFLIFTKPSVFIM